MNEGRKIIFSTIFSHLLESLSPHVSLALSDIDALCQKKNEAPEFFIAKFYHKFPRVIPLYKENISNLTQIAGTDLDNIVYFLTKALKDVLNGSNSIFAGIPNFCAAYDTNNKSHTIFIYYFSILFITDLISQITANFDCSESANVLSRSGYNVATSQQFVPEVNILIVKQWSVIFSILSEKNYQTISQIFSLFSNSADLTLPFLLFRFIRLDLEDALGLLFFEQVIGLLKIHQKKKSLTNLILESVGFMLYTLPFNDDMYQKLFSFVNPLRTDKTLWRGTVFLLTTIYQRYTKIWPKAPHFYRKRIFGVINDKTKLEFSLRCFQMSIIGRNIKPECVLWEWGPNPRASPLAFIQFNSSLVKNQSDSNSFSSIFMTIYFTKADFTICPGQFCYALVHLASLDFNHFLNILLPNFLELDDNDPRFIVLLMTIPMINSDDFAKHSFSKVGSDDINKINNLIHDKVRLALIKNAPVDPTGEHGVCVREVNFLMDSLSDESDQKLANILEEWKITSFKELRIQHNRSKLPSTKLSLMSPLLSSLEFVFTNDDFSDHEVIRVLMEMSCHTDNLVATTAYKLCSDCLTKQTNPKAFIKVVTEMRSSHRDAETTFVTLSLISQLFQNMNYELDLETLREVECSSFFIFASAYPVTRNLGIQILKNISERIGQKSLFSYLMRKMPKIEKTAKAKIMLYAIPDKPEITPPPASTIAFHIALLSHYYQVWIFFLSEMLTVLIASNYTPLFNFLDKFREEILEKVAQSQELRPAGDTGFLLILLSSQYHLSTLSSTSYIDFSNPYEKFATSSVDVRKKVCSVVHKLLSAENNDAANQIGFSIIRHLNFSLQPPMIDVLSAARADQYEEATWTVSLIIRQPELGKLFFKHNLIRIINFITNVQYHLIKLDMNSSRLIQWNNESENKILQKLDFLRNFCVIVQSTFRTYSENVSLQDWQMAHRNVLIRFFVNWALTTKPELLSLRRYASSALVMIAKVGPFFTDTILINDVALEFFGNLEREEMPILNNLLNFHFDVILSSYINACYTLPRVISDLFFEAIVKCVDDTHLEYLVSMSGPILFLCQVYSLKEHPHAALLVEKFLLVAQEMDFVHDDNQFNNDIANVTKSLPKIFSYATEAVFASFFKVMKLKNLHISLNDIIESIRPWISGIRLLPKQSHCSNYALPEFCHFTPYEFLYNMMEITEYVDDDQFRMMMSLWISLGNAPDHVDLIPLFLSEWKNFTTKKIVFELLLEANSLNLPERIAHRCGFAFYFHVTRWQHHTFKTEQEWMGLLLANIFHKNWNLMKQRFPSIIQFSFLFREKGSKRLFDILCRNLRIECFEGPIPPPIMRNVVRQFLKVMNKKNIIEWGNEALKWIFGSPHLPFVSLSLLIYNQIMKPFDEEIIGLIIKIVAFHIDKSSEDTKTLCQLVSQSFDFFNQIFEKHEEVSYNYASSFLDNRLFVETSLIDAMPIFLKSIRSGYHDNIDPQNLISIIRPLVPVLENDAESRSILDELIKKYKNVELMMIAAPLKMDDQELFPSSPPFKEVFARASETELCKSLVHYSMMIQTASYILQNSIYKICSKIAEKVKGNENNKVSLAKIYQVSLRSMSRCTNAMELMEAICINMPEVSLMSVFDIFEWDRNLEDVSRNLKILAKKYEMPIPNVTISDCRSYKTIVNVLFTDQIPKILPYAAQEETLEAMKRIKSEKKETGMKTQLTASTGKMENTFESYSITKSVSVVFSESSKSESCELAPLPHPTKIIYNKKVFRNETKGKNKGTRVTADEFLQNELSE